MTAHINEARLRVYRVLGGQLDAVMPHLQLPWRLALSMHLWWASWPAHIGRDRACSSTAKIAHSYRRSRGGDKLHRGQ